MTEQRKASDSSRAAKVVLKSDNDDMSVVVACVHIISGQKTRKITGNTPEKRAKFKAACVAHVIDQTFKAAERYPSKAAIICGDFNADLNLVNDAANAVADTRSAVIIGIEKDFIISSWECDDSNSRVVQAHDGAHSAVNAGFAQPRQAPSASKKRSTQSMTTEEPKSKRLIGQQGLHLEVESRDVHDDKAVVNSMLDAGQTQATGGSSFLARG